LNSRRVISNTKDNFNSQVHKVFDSAAELKILEFMMPIWWRTSEDSMVKVVWMQFIVIAIVEEAILCLKRKLCRFALRLKFDFKKLTK
jgi:hypothetical protein